MKNVEIKAKCYKPGVIHRILMQNGACFKGEDQQTDTYFNVPFGRLKLREGNIENALIYYNRNDQKEAKISDFELYKPTELDRLKHILKRSLGIKVIVSKRRKIYYINHVKFHIDEVDGLGSFVEIEVTDMEDERELDDMQKTCKLFIKKLKVKKDDLVSVSYSDLLELKKSSD